VGLVHAFGHVSLRQEDRALITPTSPPLDRVGVEDVLSVPLLEEAPDLPERAPLETPLHVAIYLARNDVGAICRVHGAAITVWSTVGIPPLLHGFGGMVEPVAWWDDPTLVVTQASAQGVAAALAMAPAAILRGNGAVVVGRDLDQALARAWALEDRCRIALGAGREGRRLSQGELQRRAEWFDAEERRLAAWLVGP
jgi:ribulose-5-phosphate 4-epimerase/fuculose-1-phosphate aldolase